MKYNQISWLGKPESRILSIRAFRRYIETLPFQKAVSETEYNWKASPKLNKTSFDVSSIETWPTPWELFSENAYCENLQTLGAFYTLILSKHSENHDISLAIVHHDLFGEYAMLTVDGNVSNEYDLVRVISPTDIKYKLGA